MARTKGATTRPAFSPSSEDDDGPAAKKYSSRQPQLKENSYSHTSNNNHDHSYSYQHANHDDFRSDPMAVSAADYKRASTTSAKMPSPERDHGPASAKHGAQWRPQRQKESHTSYHHGHGGHQQSHHDGLNDLDRHERSRGHSVSRSHSKRSDQHDSKTNYDHWEQTNCRDKRGRREYEYEREYKHGNDDGNDRRGRAHGRDRDYGTSNHHPYHRLDYCRDRPRDRYYQGHNSGYYQSRDRGYPSRKRSKFDNNYTHSNSNQSRQGPRGRNQHRMSSQRQYQPNKTLSLKVAKLEKDIQELKSESDPRPESSNNLDAPSVPMGGPRQEISIVMKSDDVQPDVASGETKGTNLTMSSSASTVKNDQNEDICNANIANSTSQTRKTEALEDCEESCYDASTDEEINNASQSDQNYQVTGHDANGGESEDVQSTGDIGSDNESDEDSVDPVLKESADGHYFNMSFCCQNCRCLQFSEAKFLKYYDVRNNCGNSGEAPNSNKYLYHKGCCHGDRKGDNEDYISPMADAMWKQKQTKKEKCYTRKELRKSYNTAKREETQYENEEVQEAKDNSIYTVPAYTKFTRKFQQRKKVHRRPLKVLDLFSGIGSGAVVLKRLKLPIGTIVHVEHDPVAVEVCRFNHKADAIAHHYVETFEEVYGTNDDADDEKVEAVLDEYGHFDLVLAGAPCQNYSGLNAYKNDNSENAQYLLKVGRLIQKLDEIQMGSRNVRHNVLFLSENVVFKEHAHIDICYCGEGSLPPIHLDAKNFGPCKRNRFYWTNIPIKSTENISKVASAVSVDHGFLDKGYGAVARLLQDDNESMSMPVKSNTFLASLTRIDDGRMNKYKTDDNVSRSHNNGNYHIETYSVKEREKMMGLPSGYVEKPLRKLFGDLTQKAFFLPETSKDGKTYRSFLPRNYWHFRKKCNFKFLPHTEYPFFKLALSSPLEGKAKLDFYEEEQYCKHLVGNGWSIPVVEHLLESLKELFADDVVMPDYDKYNNRHPWEPYISR